MSETTATKKVEGLFLSDAQKMSPVVKDFFNSATPREARNLAFKLTEPVKEGATAKHRLRFLKTLKTMTGGIVVRANGMFIAPTTVEALAVLVQLPSVASVSDAPQLDVVPMKDNRWAGAKAKTGRKTAKPAPK